MSKAEIDDFMRMLADGLDQAAQSGLKYPMHVHLTSAGLAGPECIYVVLERGGEPQTLMEVVVKGEPVSYPVLFRVREFDLDTGATGAKEYRGRIMTIAIPRVALESGRCVITPAAEAALRENHVTADEYVRRHQGGDWGELEAEDVEFNNGAVSSGTEIQSEYKLADGRLIWVITDAENDDHQREHTTVLLPSEY